MADERPTPAANESAEAAPRVLILESLTGLQAIVLGGIVFIAEQGSKEANEQAGLEVIRLSRCFKT